MRRSDAPSRVEWGNPSSLVRPWMLPMNGLSDAPIGVVIGVNRSHLIILRRYQAILEIPFTGESIDGGHVAVGVIGVEAVGNWRLEIGDFGKRVRSGRICWLTANPV